MRIVNLICMIILIIGGLNWGVVGLLKFNLIDFIFGNLSTISRSIYILIGLCAIYQAGRLQSAMIKKGS